MPASVNLLDRAAALLPPSDAVRLDLLSDLAFALFEVGELDRSSRILAEVIERGTAIGDRRAVARATVKRDHVEFYAHPEEVDQSRVLRDATRAIPVLRAAGDEAGLARAWTLVSEIRAIAGNAALGAKAAVRAARHARRVGSRRDEAWSLGTYGFDVIIGPTRVADGVRDLERRLHEAAGDAALGVNLSSCLAPLEAMEGRIGEARERIARSRVVTEEFGLRWQTGTHDLWSAVIEMLADDPAAAEAHLRTAVETFTATGDMWFWGSLWLSRRVPSASRDAMRMLWPLSRDSIPCRPKRVLLTGSGGTTSSLDCSPGVEITTGRSRSPGRRWRSPSGPTFSASMAMRWRDSPRSSAWADGPRTR